jgi:hypothetical protein
MIAGLNPAAIQASPAGIPGLLSTEKGLGEGCGQAFLAGA